MFKKFKKIFSVASVALVIPFSSVPAIANPTTGKAMTLQGYPGLPSGAGVKVGCYDNCDAYNGDRPLTDKLPILCIIPGDSPVPAAYQAHSSAIRPNDWKFYMGWSGGKVGLTKPVLGTSLTSRAVANEICASTFKGSRMAEHHDNKVGGWALGAEMIQTSGMKGALQGKSKQRFWVDIKNQPNATPW